MMEGILDAGFDGIYLDWVEAYSDESVFELAADDGVDPVVMLGQEGDGDYLLVLLDVYGAAGKDLPERIFLGMVGRSRGRCLASSTCR